MFFILLTTTLMVAQEPFDCHGQYYLSLTKNGSRSSGLYNVRIAQNGTYVYLDTISPSIGLVINAMGYRITDNLIYGMDPVTAMLRKVGKDGVAIDLGIPKGIPTGIYYYAGDISPDGRYLILIGLSGNNPQIVRVDLESADYVCSFTPLKLSNPSILDIAFDPFTGILYGHDSGRKKLLTIDPETGSVNTNFQIVTEVDQIGALFFDSFGNLFGYGAYGTRDQDKFLAVDKNSGHITLLGKGPVSSGQDGCACPYTIDLQKIVTPDTAYTCSEVVYSFIFSNLSGVQRENIHFEDNMPDVLTIQKIIKNPFGGQIQVTKNKIIIEDMRVDVGIDTLQILVSIDKNASGVYSNQAVLSGLPASLGSIKVSDNPHTFIEKDSTSLFVIPVDLSYLGNEFVSCSGDSVQMKIQPDIFGIRWYDGDTSAVKWLKSPGNYPVTLTSACGSDTYQISIQDQTLLLDIPEDTIRIQLGQSANFHSNAMSDNNDLTYYWYQHTENPEVDCLYCAHTTVKPTMNGYYYLTVEDADGCTATDSVYVRVDWSSDIFAPNIITPNNDARNDIFFLSGNPLAASGKNLVIYDRWGNKVFETVEFKLNEPSYGWNGKFLGQSVVHGVYTWVAEILFIDKSVKIFSGDITVIR